MAEAQQGQYEVILREKVCTQFPLTHEGVPIPHIWIYLPKDRIQTKKICILLVLVIRATGLRSGTRFNLAQESPLRGELRGD